MFYLWRYLLERLVSSFTDSFRETRYKHVLLCLFSFLGQCLSSCRQWRNKKYILKWTHFSTKLITLLAICCLKIVFFFPKIWNGVCSLFHAGCLSSNIYILKTGDAAMMQLCSQWERTLLRMCEEILVCGLGCILCIRYIHNGKVIRFLAYLVG